MDHPDPMPPSIAESNHEPVGTPTNLQVLARAIVRHALYFSEIKDEVASLFTKNKRSIREDMKKPKELQMTEELEEVLEGLDARELQAMAEEYWRQEHAAHEQVAAQRVEDARLEAERKEKAKETAKLAKQQQKEKEKQEKAMQKAEQKDREKQEKVNQKQQMAEQKKQEKVSQEQQEKEQRLRAKQKKWEQKEVMEAENRAEREANQQFETEVKRRELELENLQRELHHESAVLQRLLQRFPANSFEVLQASKAVEHQKARVEALRERVERDQMSDGYESDFPDYEQRAARVPSPPLPENQGWRQLMKNRKLREEHEQSIARGGDVEHGTKQQSSLASNMSEKPAPQSYKSSGWTTVNKSVYEQ